MSSLRSVIIIIHNRYKSRIRTSARCRNSIKHGAFRGMEEKAILDISDLRCTETDSEDIVLDGLLGAGPHHYGTARARNSDDFYYWSFAKTVLVFISFLQDYGDATSSPSERCDDNDQSSGSLSTDQNSNSNVKRKQRRYR